ncbi:hypothetical protein AYL99_09756 [Fonsecaea erecta]|uniref:Uncharacterized protein n=1 Tax=Fonsecaea erecta TaxID=1367422 RepID=A0A178Z994_9EURO|nr:hypothetical protein AYL99_09756 [Fonsecaea erecta]OAP55605.1 hypothetical protein AYL99_09756 [Fonsecaea erecta]
MSSGGASSSEAAAATPAPFLYESPPRPPPAPLTYENLQSLSRQTFSPHPRLPPASALSDLHSGSSFDPPYLNARRHILKSAQIVLLRGQPPPNVQAQLNAIWESGQSERRASKIRRIAEKLADKLRVRYTQDKSSHDAWIAPFTWALRKLDSGHRLLTVSGEKLTGLSGPRTQFLEGSPPSPTLSMSNMVPPVSSTSHPSSSPTYITLPPRPTLLLGFRVEDVLKGLVERGLPQVATELYLDLLNEDKEICFAPTRDGRIELRYPFLAVEAQRETTGKPLTTTHYENMLSGSYIIHHQIMITMALESGCFVPGEDGQSPLFFSIAIQGCAMELWVHYFQDSEYRMNRIQDGEGMDFGDILVKLDCIISWYKDKFSTSVMDAVAKKINDEVEGAVRQTRDAGLEV